jgi:hypothetical protein
MATATDTKRWAQSETSPREKRIHTASLKLAGGLTIEAHDRYDNPLITLGLPYALNWPTGTLDEAIQAFPALLLPVLQAAASDLERIVAEQAQEAT